MKPDRRLVEELSHYIGERVALLGWVYSRRDLGGIQFLLLRDRSGVVQCVLEGAEVPLAESCLRVVGTVIANERAPGGLELTDCKLELISEAVEPTPIEVPKEAWNVSPDTLLEYRHVSVRSPRARAVLKVQAELVRAFREHLDNEGFTEIFTPKIVAAGAEGGANLFEIDYYGKRAYLAQSPQLYKQIMVGVFERVFEVGPVYRAELHHTSRHLSEYLSLDVELGFIEDDNDVMDLQESLLRNMIEHVVARSQRELTAMEANVPLLPSGPFPRIELLKARELLAERYGHEVGGKDLDPEGERLIGRWAREEHGSDFVFVTRYPQAARPFYAYPTPDGLTRSADLVFRGVEITSGGQRIHDYQMLVDVLAGRGLDPDRFSGYLQAFKFGMPPHGGFAVGAERLTALLLNVPNIRFARAFPRDGSRLQP